MLEFLRDKQLIEENPFETANIKRLHFLPFEGVNAGDYGGRVKHIAELNDSDLLLIVDNNLKTIDIAKIKVEEEEKPKFKKGPFGRPIPV
jgi:hypothetical protein